MADSWGAELKGAKEAHAALDRVINAHEQKELQKAVRMGTAMVTHEARILAPVDRGTLRASITPQVVVRTNELLGITGSNVHYAPYMEFGTRAHWPPLEALAVWARRHGTTAYVVARAIGTKGIKARKFLWRAWLHSRSNVQQLFAMAVAQLIRKRR